MIALYEFAFMVMNIFFVAGTCQLLSTLVRNRKVLEGYSLSGSLLTFFGMVFAIIGYTLLETYINVIISLPAAAFWLLASWLVYDKKSKG